MPQDHSHVLPRHDCGQLWPALRACPALFVWPRRPLNPPAFTLQRFWQLTYEPFCFSFAFFGAQTRCLLTCCFRPSLQVSSVPFTVFEPPIGDTDFGGFRPIPFQPPFGRLRALTTLQGSSNHQEHCTFLLCKPWAIDDLGRKKTTTKIP